MRWYLLLSLLLVNLTAYSEQSLEALIACDTFSDLRFSTRKDFIHLRSALREISSHTGLRLKMNILTGSSLTSNNVESWVENIEKAPADVVLFYYSGHGCQPQNMTTPWPCLMFPKKIEFFSSDALCARLKAIHSRLVIIILDCCNTTESTTPPGLQVFAPKVARAKTSLPGLKTLFLKTQGLVITAGSSPGEAAYALGNGSLFTNALIQALHTGTASTAVSWEGIFNHASEICSTRQHPISSLHIAPVPVRGKGL